MYQRLRPLIRHAAILAANQGLSFASGLLIVRALVKQDYARYTIIASAIAAVTVLADSGIISVLMTRGAGAVDKPQLRELVYSVLRVRLAFGAILSAGGALWVAILLIQLQASPVELIVWLSLLVVTLMPSLSVAIFQTVLRLKHDLWTIQWTSTLILVMRLLLIAGAMSLGVLTISTLLIISIGTTGLSLIALRATNQRHLGHESAKSDVTIGSEIRRAILQVLPSSAVLIFSDQLFLGILSFRSSPSILAEASALSRYAIAFFIINMLITDIGGPRIAALPPLRGQITRLYMRVLLIASVAIGIGAVLLITASPILLALLGPQYSALTLPFAVLMIGAALQSFGKAFEVLNQARAYIHAVWVYVPLMAIWAIWGMLFADVSTVEGAALLSLVQAVPNVLTQSFQFNRSVRHLPLFS